MHDYLCSVSVGLLHIFVVTGISSGV